MARAAFREVNIRQHAASTGGRKINPTYEGTGRDKGHRSRGSRRPEEAEEKKEQASLHREQPQAENYGEAGDHSDPPPPATPRTGWRALGCCHRVSPLTCPLLY